MPDPGTHGATGSPSPDPAQPAGNQPQSLTEERIAAVVAAELAKALPGPLNAAITNHLGRFEQKHAHVFTPKTDPTPDPAKPDDGKPPKTSAEVAALQTRLNNVETERAKEKETNLRLEREADLRRSLSRPELSLINVDQAMRIVKDDLEVGEGNRLFRNDAQRGAITLDEFTADFAKANPHLQKPTGRSGSGGTGAGNTQTGGVEQTMTPEAYKVKLQSFNDPDAAGRWAQQFTAAGGRVR